MLCFGREHVERGVPSWEELKKLLSMATSAMATSAMAHCDPTRVKRGIFAVGKPLSG